MSAQRNAIASLALGIVPQGEAPGLTGLLAADSKARDAYREDLETVGLIGLTAEATAAEFSDERFERLKAKIFAAARTTRPSGKAVVDYATVLPREQLIDFGPGLRWAVLPGQGRTTVYWIFDPPACGDLPLETHEHRQTGFVLGGDFTLLYEGGRSQQLHAGDHYAIEPGLLHGATFQSRTVLCDVYEPAKEDFEQLYAEQLAAKFSG